MIKQRDQKGSSLELALVLAGLMGIMGIQGVDKIIEEDNKQQQLVSQIQIQRANYLQEKYENLSENPQEIEKFQRAYSEHLNDIYGEN